MDFLTFKSFISTEVLILFYYIGAIILPVVTWHLVTSLYKKYEFINTAYEKEKEKEKEKEAVWKRLNKKHKNMLIIFFITSFIFMELLWRMMFEFLIAYMQTRDALLQSQI